MFCISLDSVWGDFYEFINQNSKSICSKIKCAFYGHFLSFVAVVLAILLDMRWPLTGFDLDFLSD